MAVEASALGVGAEGPTSVRDRQTAETAGERRGPMGWEALAWQEVCRERSRAALRPGLWGRRSTEGQRPTGTRSSAGFLHVW